MQLLAKSSTEGSLTEGMGWIDGNVEEIPPKGGLLVPHVGWNSCKYIKRSPLFDDIEDDSDFYFTLYMIF